MVAEFNDSLKKKDYLKAANSPESNEMKVSKDHESLEISYLSSKSSE